MQRSSPDSPKDVEPLVPTTYSSSNILNGPKDELLTNASRKQKPPSTYGEEKLGVDIVLKNYYILHSQILVHTRITEHMRARIRSFLMSQASKQWVMRSTLTLACTLLDLYFQRSGFVEMEDFQTLAIGCLILAMKMQEGKFPTISFKVFNKQDLLAWQKKIAKKLSYQLTPPTYYTFGQHVLAKWSQFSLKSSKNLKIVLIIENFFNPFIRRFYEQLDHVFMILKSLQYPLEQLVINLFFLNLRMFESESFINIQQLTNQEFCNQFYQNDDFRLFFESFLKSYSQNKVIDLDEDQGLFLKHFLMIGPTTRTFNIKPSLQDIRVWDKLQTYPKECYQRCKALMEKLKPTVEK